MTMSYLDDNSTTLETIGEPEISVSGGFEPSRVFADPVGYLERFGLRSELVETRSRGLRAAA